MFCNQFFTSGACSNEAYLVAKHVKEARFLYVPVFLYATVGDVQAAARKAWANHADVEDLVNNVSDGRVHF